MTVYRGGTYMTVYKGGTYMTVYKGGTYMTVYYKGGTELLNFCMEPGSTMKV